MEKICLKIQAPVQENVQSLLKELAGAGLLNECTIAYNEKDEPLLKEIFDKHYVPLCLDNHE